MTPRFAVMFRPRDGARRPPVVLNNLAREGAAAPDDRELVVVNSGPGDDAPNVAHPSPDRLLGGVVTALDVGPALARSRALAARSTPASVFFDDDVRANEGWLVRWRDAQCQGVVREGGGSPRQAARSSLQAQAGVGGARGYVTDCRNGDPLSLRCGFAPRRGLCVDQRLPAKHELPLGELTLPLRWGVSQLKRLAVRLEWASTAESPDAGVP